MISVMRIGVVRFAWIVLAVLAAFVIFVECLADVGGDHEPIQQPHPTARIVD
jgi:hypothetical protein